MSQLEIKPEPPVSSTQEAPVANLNIPSQRQQPPGSVIQNDVGPARPNHGSDVAVVQRLLNQHIPQLAPLAPLLVDGSFGPITESTLKAFQSRVMHIPIPDGVVSAASPTLQALTNSGVASPNPPQPPAPNHYPPNVAAFIAMALPAAKIVSQKWNVPVSVILAQSALESGWGQHVVENAYFGIKGHAPSGSSATFGTTEVIDGKVIHIDDTFRAYTSYEDSADDYGHFLNQNKRYAPAFALTKEPLKFVAAVAAAGYATAPDYAKSLTSLIVAFNLTQYDAP